MTSPAAVNQRALTAELDRLAALLTARIDDREPPNEAPERPAALETLVDAFALSAFERDVLLLCCGVELEARFAALCAAAGGDEHQRRPTFGLALAVLEDAHWSALAPAAALRRWHLIEVDPGETLATCPLRVDERVLHHLTMVDYLDRRVAALVTAVEVPVGLPASQEHAAQRLAACCRSESTPGVAVVSGADWPTRRAVVATGAALAGLHVYALAAAELPARSEERDTLVRLWEREAILGSGQLLVEIGDHADADLRRRAAAFVDALSWGVVAGAREPLRVSRPVPQIDVASPAPSEQRRLWEAALGEFAQELNGSLDALVAHFDLSAHAIAGAVASVTPGEADLPARLWDACRTQARPELDDLAQRIVACAGWDDLVLAPEPLATLHEIAAHVRGRVRVYEQWGFAGRSARGLGISALFEGASGTGKTMAAEVLAAELDLDLYRIDLSQVVSKYIGETEKNLRRVFDAAEAGGAILLFDEADALFGRRSEVKDSHDRYANIEVSYLLTRMEAYRGLAILTTNAKDAIDGAFMRRLRFVVRFAFPDEAQRAEIWRRVFPAQTPTDGLDAAALARLSLTGGNIRNIALSAAFLAADRGEAVGMSHLARAAMRECAKLERPLPEAEVRAWT